MRKSFSPSVQKHRRERGGYEKKKKEKKERQLQSGLRYTQTQN